MSSPLHEPDDDDVLSAGSQSQREMFLPDFSNISAGMNEELPKPALNPCTEVQEESENHHPQGLELATRRKNSSRENPLQRSQSQSEMSWRKPDVVSKKAEFQARIQELERASNAVASFLTLFKGAIAEISFTNAHRLSTATVLKISNQKAIFSKEIETFKRAKKVLERLLRETEYKEENSTPADILLVKLTEMEIENTNLKRKMLEKEKCIQELSCLLQKEKANNLKATNHSRSVKVVQTRLQLQIQKKEVENDQLKEYMKSLETKIAEWNTQLRKHRHQTLTWKETNEPKKIALKKATKVQRQRAECLEADIGSLTSQIKDREAKLSETFSASSVWKSHYEKVVEEKTVLEVQIETLQKQIMSLLEDLKKIEDSGRNSTEDLLEKLHSSDSKNESINHENEKIKSTFAALKDKVASVEEELLELQEVEKQQKFLAEEYKTQVQKLQAAAEEVKSRYAKVLHENKLMKASKDLELEEVRSQKEAHFKELERARGLPKAAERRLQECHKNLLYFKGRCAEQTQTVDENDSLLKALSLEEKNCHIRLKCESLERKLEQMDADNAELENKLASQEEHLKFSELQLKKKSAEYGALARKLEATLEEGRQKVSEEMERLSSKEQALQIKIFDLETELRRKTEEQKQLVCQLNNNEQYQEVCLKEMQHSLDKSENQNKSIRNYIQFLKTSYITMFG
ncbi:protein BCAP isoform X2 [Ornithorhynchus anatinus]|uniref:protein BCAP isoform X2 n=1 Tax=Ornithorhynchus anatinus TaxID=9258 RepID=UPI0010A8920F|nr:protein BCAP isoform X2 [Ornithorhynchus anatinus]